MTSNINIREIVLDMLLEVNRNENVTSSLPSHVILNKTLNKYQFLQKNDRALITKIYEGTLEYRIRLDYVINQFSNVKTNKMKPLIRQILRLSVYQILFLNKIPESAICNEAVNIVKKRGFVNLKGFVNGVLRNISRNKDCISYPLKSDMTKYLSIKYSIPEWIILLWREEFSFEEIESILKSFIEKNSTSVRIVLLNDTKENVIDSLLKQKIEVKESNFYKDALLIKNYDYLAKVNAFAQNKIVPQDISSMMTSLAANPQEGDSVIDVCASPGGKSMHVADLLKGTGHIDARDITENKVNLLNENINRIGYNNISTKIFDATILDEEAIESADIVICDVPCSGLGIIGRKPDIKYNINKEKILGLNELQKKIVINASKYVKKDKYMIYSTCTINHYENEDMILWIEENCGLKRVNIDSNLILDKGILDKGYIKMIPQNGEYDGFFVAKFQK